MRHILGFLQLLASRVELRFPRTPVYAEKLAFWFTELEVRGSPIFFIQVFMESTERRSPNSRLHILKETPKPIT